MNEKHDSDFLKLRSLPIVGNWLAVNIIELIDWFIKSTYGS
jgi:hypothetical protein